MVVKATSERRTWIERLWDHLLGIKRVPLFTNVLVVFDISTTPLPVKGTLILLANGTTWFVVNVVSPLSFTAKSTSALTNESLLQMQDYHGDGIVYALACPENQEEQLFNRNPHV